MVKLELLSLHLVLIILWYYKRILNPIYIYLGIFFSSNEGFDTVYVDFSQKE